MDTSPILCFLDSEGRVWSIWITPATMGLCSFPLLTTAAHSSDFTHPSVPLNQECRELALCMRPLDLLQGDTMGTGSREPFNGKWFLPGLGKHSLNAHITVKYLSPWLRLSSFRVVWNCKTTWEVSNKIHNPQRNVFSFYLSLKIKQQHTLSVETRLFTSCGGKVVFELARTGRKEIWPCYSTKDSTLYFSSLISRDMRTKNNQTNSKI